MSSMAVYSWEVPSTGELNGSGDSTSLMVARVGVSIRVLFALDAVSFY